MSCYCAKKFKFFPLVTLLLLLKINFSSQQQACTLPDGVTKSTCERLIHCEGLWNQVKSYGSNVPKDVRDRVNSHKCPSGGLVCCPDYAVTTSTTTTQAPTTPSIHYAPRGPTDLNAIKSHRNYGMLNDRTCGKATSDRIINGVDADLFEFPWNALLGYQLLDSFGWNCGGSLINPKFVLTAAHCITRDLKKVRLGEHNIESEKDCDDFKTCADPVQDIDIERKISHRGYKRGKKDPTNDIALLKLAKIADVTKNNVKTICLPLTIESDISKLPKQLKDKLLISGWGKINDRETSKILQKANVPLVENQECQSKFSQLRIDIHDTILCAGGHNKTDTCRGDSGGGIMSFAPIYNQPKAVLYGVISSGVACERADVIFPGIYVNVKYYLDWILDNMS